MNSLVVASCVVLALLQMTSHAWKFSPSLIRQNKILTAGINMPLFLSAKDANEIFDDDLTNGGKAKKTPHSKGRPAKAKNVQVVVSAENNIKQTATDNMPANTEKSPMHVESSVHEVFDKNPLPLSAEGRAWFPVTLLDTIDDKLPKQVELLGTKYVVWRNQANKYNRTASFGWNVMLDQCAHRLVPLSEGRVDPKTNCLECPYHGWQFESQTGKCAFIPQATRSSVNNNMNLVTPSINDRSMVSSFPVHLTPNILWAYLPMKESNKTVPELPEVMLPSLLTAKSFFSREVPYSFDVALENFMDPAHVPFAHHKLSNHRKQGAPLSIKLATNVQENEKELSFQYERDISPKFTLKALYSFYTPCYYQIRLFPSRTQQPTKQPQKDKSKQHPTKEHLISTENYRNVLSLLVVPMAPGRSRVFVVLPRAVGIASKFLPKWFQHRFWMRFFDSDIWLHDQEKVLRSPASSFDVQVNMNSSNVQNAPEKILDKFTLMTSADKGVIAWRQWWRKHMSFSPIFGAKPSFQMLPSLTTEELRDRYSSHTKDCIHCQKALQQGQRIRKYIAPLLSILVFAGIAHIPMKNLISKLSESLSSVLAGKYQSQLIVANKVIDFINAHKRGCKMVIASLASWLTYVKLHQLADLMINTALGPERYEKLSAAQMSPE